ncbi:Ribosomal RNA small subunit methyltransferase A [Folsomia candida]|uniref:Ribosomal RNA small subunit methyltransferase A n=1 Tax=Folsomia candida TaxID=158441 RepID=A0A226DB92_FOLCA|nr:Ribosomal RNA small subunit methyltransferase A [Folsomia candida]
MVTCLGTGETEEEPNSTLQMQSFDDYFLLKIPQQVNNPIHLCLATWEPLDMQIFGVIYVARKSKNCKIIDSNLDEVLNYFARLDSNTPEVWLGSYFDYYAELKNPDIPHYMANPFSHNSNISIPLYIAVLAVTGANATLKHDVPNVFTSKILIETNTDADIEETNIYLQYNLIFMGPSLSEFT